MAASILAGGLWYFSRFSAAPSPALAAKPESPECTLQPGQQVAFALRSSVSAEGQRDHFNAVMSWEVVSSNQGLSRVRAALSQVSLSQQLTAEPHRAASPEGLPFYLEIDQRCAIQSRAFSSQWRENAKLLVTTLLDNYAFRLPAAAPADQWQSQESDGIGDYRAQFTALSSAPWQIRRHKLGHKPDETAEAFGIAIKLKDNSATATFASHTPAWWQHIEGSETVSFATTGDPEMLMSMQFSLQRDDQQFAAVPALAWAEASPLKLQHGVNSSTGNSDTLALTTEHQNYREVRAAFDHAFSLKPPRYYDAALALAAWLQQQPDDVARVVAELRAAQDTNTHPTLFHALQLSGNAQAREALIALMGDPALSASDQARAVSALADLGEANKEVADLLLARAQTTDLVGDVSLLRLGSISARSNDPTLREYLGQALMDTHAAADNDTRRVLLIDAMGNSGDQRFIDVLSRELSAVSPGNRRHAARALAKLASDETTPLLVKHLATENDPRTTAELARALTKTGRPLPDAIPILEQRLQNTGDYERAAIIKLLGSQNSEAAKQALVQHFKREKSARLKQLIGRYLPATALR